MFFVHPFLGDPRAARFDVIGRFSRLGQFGCFGSSLLAASLTLAAALATPAQAQPFPEAMPITLVMPFPPGSVTDTEFRALAVEASKKLGQNIIVNNKPGATGTLGPSSMAKTAKPDGYTLSVVPSSLVGLPHLQKVSYDPLKDFTYIIGVTGYTFSLMVRSDSPYKNLDELVTAARAKPGVISFGSSGIGGSGHLMVALLEQCQKVSLNHVPYKGGAEVTLALLGGHVDALSDGSWGALADSGKARPLIMLTPNRVPQYPNVPTLKETCPNGYADTQMIGIAGPAGMDAKLVQKLHDAFRDSMSAEPFLAALASGKQVPLYLSSRDYASYMEKTFFDRKKLVKSIGLAIE